jgi:hypothetical protein
MSYIYIYDISTLRVNDMLLIAEWCLVVISSGHIIHKLNFGDRWQGLDKFFTIYFLLLNKLTICRGDIQMLVLLFSLENIALYMEMYVCTTYSGITCIESHICDYRIPLFHHS